VLPVQQLCAKGSGLSGRRSGNKREKGGSQAESREDLLCFWGNGELDSASKHTALWLQWQQTCLLACVREPPFATQVAAAAMSHGCR
jgi:hypothetical protein